MPRSGCGTMHEGFRRRLEVLEAARLRQREAMRVISIVFEGTESTYADGPDGFRCDRRADEDLADFESRAEAEVLAFNPHPIVPPILIFRF
jgi:hypothetical protein